MKNTSKSERIQKPEAYVNVNTFCQQSGYDIGRTGFLRSLPDSVDFVVLTNADNLSVYDKEDISKLNGLAPNFSITRIYPNSTTNAKKQKTWKNSKRK